MQLEWRTVDTRGAQGRVHRAARVDDQDIACFQDGRELAEARVQHAAIPVVRDHEAYLVAREAARFGWLAGFQRWWEVEIQDRSILAWRPALFVDADGWRDRR